MGAAGLKLTPGLQEPAAAKPAKINQPPPQFLIKLLGETRVQQAPAGLIYRSKFVQGTPTPRTLQPKTHAAAAGILTKIFAGQIQPRAPSPEADQSSTPEPNHVAPSPTLSLTTARPYNQP